MKNFLIGDTIKFTWVSSGVVPSSIYAAIFDGNESLVNSASMVSSGNGHFYSLYTVSDSAGFYVSEMKAIVNSKPYKKRVRFQAVLEEVD